MFSMRRWKIKRLSKKIKAMQNNRVNNQPGDEIIKREILCYFELAALLKKMKCSKKFPFSEIMLIECYRKAAELDDSSAHYQLAQMFIDEAKYRQNLDSEGVFDSSANLRRSQQLYEEAHAHLLAAEKLGHIAAKRFRGLCIINGWGVIIDKDKGFELIVESIEQEGSWDKIPQIFASMGLNKPEFFSAIMQRKKESH
ncbi:hypothetical protein [Legionella worsleiensis]|uniref:Sel1 repeat protein n=1 Tax=Legionella worsleiensis TaxID=45076 RepID=A0A0W1AJG3_9GAMM|nr:hypothetical protein [Legionella worsleiensis]KTD81374.1 hypothetical protein Lwor_0651 [Legionella worsleiensis]STY29991.1 Uncharacterised protein [Legionella worsleiensis]